MDTARLPEIIQEMYCLIDELEAMFEGRHFTPDGHTVGSIGEAIAAHYYGLELLPASTKGRDATIETKPVEIKATQGDSIALRHEPETCLSSNCIAMGLGPRCTTAPATPFGVWSATSHSRRTDSTKSSAPDSKS